MTIRKLALVMAALVCLAGCSSREERALAMLAEPPEMDGEFSVSQVGAMDLNRDGLPEMILGCADGWSYKVFYYTEDGITQVPDLEAWTWSSDLLAAEDGTLVLAAYAHTTGTAGLLQYRIYGWDGKQYTLSADLCRIPVEWDEKGEPTSYCYYRAEDAVEQDIYLHTEPPLVDGQVTQEAFEAELAACGELGSVRAQLVPCAAQTQEHLRPLWLKALRNFTHP